MEATELRIENIVYNRHGEFQVITHNSFQAFRHPTMDGNPSGFKPVPLTEELLIKNGFTKDTTNNTVWIDLQTHYLEFMEADGCFYPRYCQYGEISSESEQCVSLNRINSLHQLQNLYYALTGTELEINL